MLPAPVHPLSPDAHAHSSAAAARESSASYLTASDLGAALSSGEAAVASTSTSSSAAVAAATTADDKATGAAAKTAGGAAETRRRGQLERILAGRDPRSSLSTTASRTTAPSEPRRLRKTQPPPSSSSRSSSAHRKPLPHGATTISHSNSSSKDDATTTIVLPRTPAEMTLDELEPVAKAWDARLVAALVRSLSRELSYATTRSARDEGQTTTAAAASTRRRRDRRRVGQGGESPTETGHDSDERRGPKGKRVVYDQGASREDWLPSRSRRRGQQAGKRKRVPWRGWDDELPVGASSGDRRDAVEEEEDESAGAASDSAHSSDDSHAERLRRPAHRHPPRRPERHASAVQHDEETGEWRITLHLGEDEEVEGEGSRVRGEDGSSELADAQEVRLKGCIISKSHSLMIKCHASHRRASRTSQSCTTRSTRTTRSARPLSALLPATSLRSRQRHCQSTRCQTPHQRPSSRSTLPSRRKYYSSSSDGAPSRWASSVLPRPFLYSLVAGGTPRSRRASFPSLGRLRTAPPPPPPRILRLQARR